MRDRLRLTLDGLRQDLTTIEAELVATRAVRANGGDDDEHDPDGIPLSSVLQSLEGQKRRIINGIREAEAALVDLGRGHYGICAVCGQPIPAARLEIRPTTRTCVECAG